MRMSVDEIKKQYGKILTACKDRAMMIAETVQDMNVRSAEQFGRELAKLSETVDPEDFERYINSKDNDLSDEEREVIMSVYLDSREDVIGMVVVGEEA